MRLEKKVAIRNLSFDQLKAEMLAAGEPAFRAKQVYEWIWKKAARSFDAMGNVPKTTREWLSEKFSLQIVTTAEAQYSSDRTIKSSFQLHDNNLVEGVLIPTRERVTACVSSQVGCSLTCSFCATGYMDRKRNLESFEIYDQVVLIRDQAQEKYGQALTNIVYMGMGEPLLNYANVLKSIEQITSPEGLGMSPRRITVSTAGIAKMIQKLGDDQVKFNLALSLHAANDTKRNQIMPINESNTLDVLKAALLYFFEKTGNEITLEYIVFNKFNDTIEDARELYEFAKGIPCKINLIEYNPIAQSSFVNAEADAIAKFSAFLESKRMIVNIRRSRGRDIDAACGQLAGKKAPVVDA
ncbi:23S rRNA (adenine(2503)-C(2))-methyltransferase RlmN [Aquirufa antheringensis]|uniref:Probable dual-specificity RNA methyltransferase RlmN n=2 Tax=Aquirufa antheringensis TaxID=2516559 RepID=A0A4Q9BI66_9BACT|nr:23S rRNA (adenine(2503)-C(2))-methyltransferase RlmN [Aquirufa antheringensis]MCZ2486885.1 23S rRNA (adenine(2503)-C(2))-methyltransferase RlmN [Aquirufa antheringensis]MCZ2490125.1 23S rRNA (adenine(2503)-C(2))-methyltransferase RlmN [Aquirufa antheringensis]TBH74998.1 23S rRNA (adenine(2503)-C(2))-methyltransferase RlmN [Aquirufa antheringensis]USQ04661.1 23S rRNA (adenine(2503)-C(2))-methyltransferase RlmN [Aquirufa antheringensis]